MRVTIFTALLFITSTAIAQSGSAPCPCCTEAHRAFDFWLGDWEAYAPNDKLAGTNHIVTLHDSCIIQENWVSAAGNFTGTSYNYYDPSDSTWNQIWLDNKGGNLILKGRHAGNQMILSAPANAAGNTPAQRITWTVNLDGTVRQHWETASAGEAWETAFDGLYRKKDQAQK